MKENLIFKTVALEFDALISTSFFLSKHAFVMSYEVHFITFNPRRCLCCNGYRHRKWTR